MLDAYTTAEGRRSQDEFKNGTDYTVRLDAETYTRLLGQELDTGASLTGHNPDGQIRFQLSNIRLEYTVSNRIRSTATIYLEILMTFAGRLVTTLRGDFTVYGKYEQIS